MHLPLIGRARVNECEREGRMLADVVAQVAQ